MHGLINADIMGLGGVCYREFHKNIHLLSYRGFDENGSLSYLCALGTDRQSPLNECTLQEPFYEISCMSIY